MLPGGRELEHQFDDMAAEERYTRRLEQAKPVLEALFAWANGLPELHYLLELQPYLLRYLEDGRLEINSNRVERSIKPFAMDRKNRLFANTPAGA